MSSKKWYSKLIVGVLLISLVFSLGACGSEKPVQSPQVEIPEFTLPQTNEPDVTEAPEPETNEAETEPEKDDTDDLDPDFIAAMDSYEEFMNEYVAFMKKYQDDPSNLSLLSDYADYMSKYADFVEDFEKWEDEEMNAAETAYYIEVQTRINKKLLEITK